MAKINRFEELKVWQKSIDFCDSIYALINTSDLSKDFGLRDQMNRSSISIASNIAEGFERNSTKSFIYFLKISKGSAGELRTQLHLAKRRNYLNETLFNQLIIEITEIGKMLGSFITYLKTKNQNNILTEPEVKYTTLSSDFNIDFL